MILSSLGGGEFERTLDQLFEDILITGWRGPARVRTFADALVTEHPEQYRVKITVADAAPDQMEVEVTEWRLTVGMPTAEGQRDRIFEFSRRIDTERVTARFEDGVLEIILPKSSSRRIAIQ